MRIVVAVGGNALLLRGERPDASVQMHHIAASAKALARIATQHQVVICHGNGPQVGLLALESENDKALTQAYPLDVLGAQTQGMIGYWFVQALRNAGLAGPVVSLVTQTRVDRADPAFTAPTKLVGPAYSHDDAMLLAARHRWQIARDGARWRRVVPSPEPLAVVELDTIRLLVETGATVVCAGGGGAPVATSADGKTVGVEAVVDKDLTAALLATELDADRLLVLSDVASVQLDFGTPTARPLGRANTRYLASLDFPAGSMAPKVLACSRFAEATGRPANIGSLLDAEDVLAGLAGTTVVADAATAGPVAAAPAVRGAPIAVGAARSAGTPVSTAGPSALN